MCPPSVGLYISNHPVTPPTILSSLLCMEVVPAASQFAASRNAIPAELTCHCAAGNEPHHIGISFDRKTILGSGLLSFLKLQVRRSCAQCSFDMQQDIHSPRLVPLSCVCFR